MKYAKLLDFKLDKPEIKKAIVLGQYGRMADEENASVTQMYIPKKYVNAVREKLPSKLRERVTHITYAEIRVSGPHVHTAEQSVINYYIETNGEVTAFYEGEARIDHTAVMDTDNDYYVIEEDSVQEVEHFIARDGDVWLMSTRQPHSIYADGNTKSGREKYRHIEGQMRKVVQIYMDIPYQEAALLI